MGAVHEAIKKCEDMRAWSLLEQGADVNTVDEEGNTPLMLAARRSRYGWIVPCLLKRGADIHAKNAFDQTPLMLALDHHALWYEDNMSVLWDYYAYLGKQPEVDPEFEKGRLALLLAIYSGNTSAVQSLLDSRANVHARDGRGWTPLIYAVSCNRLPMVRLLLEHGADQRAAEQKMRPLHYAARGGYVDIARLLLE